MMTFELTSSIPPPSKIGRFGSKYPFRIMRIGESFRISDVKVTSVPITYWSNVTGFRFTCKTVVEDGQQFVRVWRVE